MRMARVNIYLPDDLADAARSADLNISSLTQTAIRRELRRGELREWMTGVSRLPRLHVDHAAVVAAVDEAREEFGRVRG